MKSIRRVFGGDDSAKEEAKPTGNVIERRDDPAKALAALSNQQQREALAAQDKAPGGFSSIVRDADAIEQSGVLQTFAELDASQVEGKSERKRTLDDDALIVQSHLGGMTAEQIAELKEQAFAGTFADDQDGRNKDGKFADENRQGELGAHDKDHYGSELHKEYGATVEFLTGGVISAEEAMAMNPTGGIAGPGANGIAFKKDGALRRHAIRHDAVGFLKTRFDIGPGYGTKTSMLGFQSSNPLAGQWGGIGREFFKPSDQVDASSVGTSARFGGQGTEALTKKPKKS